MADNKRFIDIDVDTRVGFNYIKQQFYVINKEYTTYRNTLAQIREVLTALEIPNDNPTDEEIQALADYIENLYKVSYTLQDTGAYIHSLQFNDFSKYPLTIDCEKAKLYVMNSTIIYDLTLNESPRNVRIPRILSFYKNTLGLEISVEDMRYFYSLLLSFYHPTCYNQITEDKDTGNLFYGNKFLLSNYNNTSNAMYQCTYNPNNTADNTRVGYALSTDTDTSTITTASPITEDMLQGRNKIILKGTTTTVDGTKYSADGEYTIDSMGGNTIKIKETLPYTYNFPYKECYVLSAQAEVIKMEYLTRQITLTNLPSNVLTGDVILISGATVTTEYETISCNGTYTIELIQEEEIPVEEPTETPVEEPNENEEEPTEETPVEEQEEETPTQTQKVYVLTVAEEIPTDFTGSATLTKEVFISNISSIRAKKLTLTDTTDLDLTGATVMVHTTTDDNVTIEPYNVNTFTSNSITVMEDISAYSYTSTCPRLYIPVPSPAEDVEVLINVTSVSENAETVFPMGEFMVDTFEQCQNYIGTLAGLVKPTETTKENLYKQLPTSMELTSILDLTTAFEGDTITCSIESMNFVGLYSKIYSE